MSTAEERMQILKMVEDGKISAEEGARLLSALAAGARTEKKTPTTSSGARWFRVRVTDLITGKDKVNVNIPMGLVNVGLKMGARFAPEIEGTDFDEVIASIKSGAHGKVFEATDEERGEHVEIFVE